MSHTPGPWFNTSEDDYPTGQVSTTPLKNGDICVIYNDNAKADARLIAAAPDLLAALSRIAALDPGTDSDEGYNEWGEADCFRKAQAIALNVVSKATGETQ